MAAEQVIACYCNTEGGKLEIRNKFELTSGFGYWPDCSGSLTNGHVLECGRCCAALGSASQSKCGYVASLAKAAQQRRTPKRKRTTWYYPYRPPFAGLFTQQQSQKLP